MGVLLIIINSFLVCADENKLLHVKNLQQFYSTTQLEDQTDINQRRCKIELRDHLIPSHCYVWVKQSAMSGAKQRILVNWLDEVCRQNRALEQGSPSYALSYLGALSSSCRQVVQNWGEEWLYQLSREDRENFLQRVQSKIGKEFERHPEDGRISRKKRYQVSNTKTHRRGIN